ncbi:MAG TPA: ribosome recycling factor [Chitinophagaceae bacterium]|nr:ribosome recycling factor [Chitinophagaceae bacterium]
MQDELNLIIEDANESMEKAIRHLELELSKLRAGKANPQMFDGISVEYYGSITPLSQVSNISASDVRTITIQPWEKNMLQAIEKAIISANMGVTPQNDGHQIRIFLPPLTEERRKELVKKVNVEGEHAKIAVRNIRRDIIEHIKRLQKEGLSEDIAKDSETRAQDITNKFILLIEKHCSMKDKEIMFV